jgi:RHS repeat-associated protein
MRGPRTRTKYAYDDDGNLVEETNAAGAAVARYAQGLNIDEPLAMFRSGTTSFYDPDGLGDITSLANGAGALAQTYTFDSFGKLTGSSGSLTNTFQYTARDFDSETGLYYYRTRYYDPTIGRFISEDSREVSLLSQIKNLYAYALGNPVNFSDPLGLFGVKPGVPYPNLRLEALLDCIEWYVGVNTLMVTSTNEPSKQHGPNDVHRRGEGLAVDIHYPTDPDAVLNAAACCGAPFARDEKKDPSARSTFPHIHLQLVPGPAAHNWLPKHPKCKGCS